MSGVHIHGLRFARSTGFVLDVPAWAVEPGALAVVHGPSGAGKTTLLGLLSGALVSGRGEVRVDGVDPAALTPAARRRWRLRHVGLMFQDAPLIPHLSVLENVLLPLRLDRRVDGPARARARTLLEDLELPAGGRSPATLSHGEGQRVAIARALIAAPRLVLADEPTSGLDAARRDRVIALFERVRAAHGVTVVIVTHDPAVVARGDRALALRGAAP